MNSRCALILFEQRWTMPIYIVESVGGDMNRKSIAVIRKLMETDRLTKEEISQLKTDERKGIQQLLKSYERKQVHKQKLAKQFKQMWQYEQKGYANGLNFIAGIDEAGRGPLAGPVVAAAVILPREFTLLGLTDSKQLSKLDRERFFHIIKSDAISYGIASVSNTEIDNINIYEATKVAMERAVLQLEPQPDHALIDAVTLESLPMTSDVITKGDEKSITIAAASILAKVTRDDMMNDIAQQYPNYGFQSHKGYGTRKHLLMLKKYGPTPYHRTSFAPVRQLMK